MKNLSTLAAAVFISAGVTLTAVAGPATIHDLYSKDKEIAAPEPTCTWTGFYLGVNAGGWFNSDNDIDTDSVNTFATPLAGGPVVAAAITRLSNFDVSSDDSGFIGGGQIGYNRQFGNRFVAGIEADIQGQSNEQDSIFETATTPLVGFPNNSVTQRANLDRSIDYLGTLRARLGFLACQRLLFYVTGGLAYGGVHAATDLTQTINGPSGAVPPTESAAGSTNEPRAGWTAGAGTEWMFTCHWSAKVEYLHYDLGDVSYFLSPLVFNAPGVSVPATVNVIRSTTSFDGNVVRAGLNFHF